MRTKPAINGQILSVAPMWQIFPHGRQHGVINILLELSYTVASRELVRQFPIHGGVKTPPLFRESPNTPTKKGAIKWTKRKPSGYILA